MTDPTPTWPRLIWRYELGVPLPPEHDTERDSEANAPAIVPIQKPGRLAILRIHGLLVLLTVLLLLVILALAQAVIVPIVLAAFFATCLSPLVALMSRVLWRGLAAALVTLLVIALLYLGILALIGPAQEWMTRLPESLQQLNLRLRDVVRGLGSGSGALMQFDTESMAPTRISLWGALSATPPILTKLFSVILLTYFFLLHGDRMLRRLVELSPSLSQKKRAVAIVRAIQSDTTRYLFITTLINSLLGLLTAGMLMLYDFPDPWLFGALAGLANFIPYVGALSIAALLALVGMTTSPQFGLAILPALSFMALTALEGNFVSPAILGQRLSLSPVAILLWLMIWGWLWGLPGVLLGVPMLMCLKIIAERIDGARWFARAIE